MVKTWCWNYAELIGWFVAGIFSARNCEQSGIGSAYDSQVSKSG